MKALVRAGCMAALLATALPAFSADGGWLESGDEALRMDLALLNDAEVIRLPVTHWPMPRESLRYALANARNHFATNVAVQNALARVRAVLEPPSRQAATQGARLDLQASLTAGRAGLLREFDSLGREDAELGARAGFDSGRWSAALNVAAVTDPADGKQVRFDKSHATLQLGNWLFSANTLERFWGPSHVSSLILSNNARPMPTLTLERAQARAFKSRWLDWLGPWRFSLAVSRMEGEREDIDAPLFLAMRITAMPFKKMELGFTRTAQFCGEQLACDWSSITEMLIGNDNVGIDASEENEPGNQMAGFDLRWTSPLGNLPYAIYSQMIGEDESGFLPVKYLAQFGAEVWKPMGDGGIVLGFLEYSDNTCSASRNPPRFDCAYNQRQFDVEGYRYYGRVIGHTADRDAEAWSAGLRYTTPGGELWSATAMSARLNRNDVFDPRNTVSAVPADFTSLKLGWRGMWLGDRVSVELGAQALEPDAGGRELDAFGFVRWQHDFGK